MMEPINTFQTIRHEQELTTSDNSVTFGDYIYQQHQKDYLDPTPVNGDCLASSRYGTYQYQHGGSPGMTMFSHQVFSVNNSWEYPGNNMVKQERNLESEVVIPVTLMRLLQDSEEEEEDDIKTYLTSGKKKKKKGNAKASKTLKVSMV